MSAVRWSVSTFLAGALTVAAIGCGGKQTGPVAKEVVDPVQEEIMQKAIKKAPKEVPPGYTVNSGGELVKIPNEDESNQ
jgi:hypothetical protein